MRCRRFWAVFDKVATRYFPTTHRHRHRQRRIHACRFFLASATGYRGLLRNYVCSKLQIASIISLEISFLNSSFILRSVTISFSTSVSISSYTSSLLLIDNSIKPELSKPSTALYIGSSSLDNSSLVFLYE